MQKIFALLIVLMTTNAFAKHIYLELAVLTPKKIEKVIGDFPKKGSAEEAADFNTLLAYQQTRTAADCARAEKESNTSLDTLFGGETGILSKQEVKKMKFFLLKVDINVGANALIAKQHYKRPRPYLSNTAIKPCIGLEKSFAYPSGHTLMARLTARVLSKVYPERAEKLMARSAQYSLNRIIGGVHHPSDVAASYVLADYLAAKMMDDDKFVKALISQ